MNAGCGIVSETCMLGSVNVVGSRRDLDQSRRERMATAHHPRAYPTTVALLADGLIDFSRENHAAGQESDIVGNLSSAEYAVQGEPLNAVQEFA